MNIIEIRTQNRIRVGVDILIPDFKNVDLILWNWDGLYALIPKPIIENMKEYVKTHYPLVWDNGKENHETPLVSTSKNRPKQLDFTWVQAREIEPYIADTLKGL